MIQKIAGNDQHLSDNLGFPELVSGEIYKKTLGLEKKKVDLPPNQSNECWFISHVPMIISPLYPH
jgi:hypothetical protein